jgi:site-specific DNA-methyltransferase (adenine-specific)
MINKVLHGDCLELMKDIPDGSVDMILCDLPYGTTACKWDTIIPFEPLWEQYGRIIKLSGAIVLTASQPFTSALVMSNPKLFKYEWIWQKNRGSNFAILKYQPMKEHESVLVFSKKTHLYFPVMEERKGAGLARTKYEYNPTNGNKRDAMSGFEMKHANHNGNNELRYPSSIQKINCEVGFHPTQKPVALFEYLIKTYTNEGDVVLDNCAGSGTTAIACINTNRNYILMEKEKKYYDIILERIENHTRPSKKEEIRQLDLFFAQ